MDYIFWYAWILADWGQGAGRGMKDPELWFSAAVCCCEMFKFGSKALGCCKVSGSGCL
jgi:hypothetical protein